MPLRGLANSVGAVILTSRERKCNFKMTLNKIFMQNAQNKEVLFVHNSQVRAEARKYHVPLWELAEALGFSEMTLFRRLRHELSDSEREECLQKIRDIAAGRLADEN